MIDAKLSKLVEFYKKRLDSLDSSDNEFDKGLYVAFSISMIKTREIVWELLDSALKPNDDLTY